MDHQSFMETQQYKKQASNEDGENRQVDALVIPKIAFTLEEVELFRQWFNSMLDTNPKYVKEHDIFLCRKIYKILKMRIPKELSNFSE